MAAARTHTQLLKRRFVVSRCAAMRKSNALPSPDSRLRIVPVAQGRSRMHIVDGFTSAGSMSSVSEGDEDGDHTVREVQSNHFNTDETRLSRREEQTDHGSRVDQPHDEPEVLQAVQQWLASAEHLGEHGNDIDDNKSTEAANIKKGTADDIKADAHRDEDNNSIGAVNSMNGLAREPMGSLTGSDSVAASNRTEASSSADGAAHDTDGGCEQGRGRVSFAASGFTAESFDGTAVPHQKSRLLIEQGDSSTKVDSRQGSSMLMREMLD